MAQTPTCGQCPHYQSNRRTNMAQYGMHSCAKGLPWTYYDTAHVCHRLDAQPASANRTTTKPPRGQIGLIGD